MTNDEIFLDQQGLLKVILERHKLHSKITPQMMKIFI